MYALSLIYKLGMAYLKAGVHVRQRAKSLRLGAPSHLDLRFKVIGSAAAFTEGFFVSGYTLTDALKTFSNRPFAGVPRGRSIL